MDASFFSKLIESACSGGWKAVLEGLDWKSVGGIDAEIMPSGLTPLSYCIKTGRLDLVRVLMGLGADAQKVVCVIPDFHTALSLNALQFTTYHGKKDILRALHEEFNVSLGRDDSTAAIVGLLIGATEERDSEFKDCLDYLVSKNADINRSFKTSVGTSRGSLKGKLVHTAAALAKCNMLKALVEHGADVNALNAYGESPVWFTICEQKDPDARIRVYRCLHSLGANFEITYGDDKITLLHDAVNRGDDFCDDICDDIKVLVQLCPALLESQDLDGERAVHHAASHNHVGSLRTLLSLSADMNALNSNRQTPLDLALTFGFADSVDFLTSIVPHVLSIPRKYYTFKPGGLGWVIKLDGSSRKLSSPMVKLEFPHETTTLSLSLSINSSERPEIHAALNFTVENYFCNSFKTGKLDCVWVQRHNRGCHIEMNDGNKRLIDYLMSQQSETNDSVARFVSMDAKRDDGKDAYCNILMKDLFDHCEEHLEKEFAVGAFDDGSKQTNCTWFCIEFLKKHGFTIEKSDMKECIKSIVSNDVFAEMVLNQFSALWKRDVSEIAQLAPRLFKKRKESQGLSNNENQPANPLRMRETMGF